MSHIFTLQRVEISIIWYVSCFLNLKLHCPFWTVYSTCPNTYIQRERSVFSCEQTPVNGPFSHKVLKWTFSLNCFTTRPLDKEKSRKGWQCAGMTRTGGRCPLKHGTRGWDSQQTTPRYVVFNKDSITTRKQNTTQNIRGQYCYKRIHNSWFFISTL